jgi:hypothetical protein
LLKAGASVTLSFCGLKLFVSRYRSPLAGTFAALSLPEALARSISKRVSVVPAYELDLEFRTVDIVSDRITGLETNEFRRVETIELALLPAALNDIVYSR